MSLGKHLARQAAAAAAEEAERYDTLQTEVDTLQRTGGKVPPPVFDGDLDQPFRRITSSEARGA